MKKSFILGMVLSLSLTNVFAQASSEEVDLEMIGNEQESALVAMSRLISQTSSTSSLVEIRSRNTYSLQTYNVVINEFSDSLYEYSHSDLYTTISERPSIEETLLNNLNDSIATIGGQLSSMTDAQDEELQNSGNLEIINNACSQESKILRQAQIGQLKLLANAQATRIFRDPNLVIAQIHNSNDFILDTRNIIRTNAQISVVCDYLDHKLAELIAGVDADRNPSFENVTPEVRINLDLGTSVSRQ